MYIVSANQSQVVDSTFVERFVLVEKSDAVILAASYNDTRLPVTLAKFRTMSEARNTLLDLANALGGGQTVYHLQDYLADGSMTWNRDARVKRRGGS